MVPAPTRIRADELLKYNIETLLKARGQSRTDLARWCRQSRSWVDKFMSEQRRGIPAKYLDRIADFFGIATYQLLQPGISPLTERRVLSDRRSGRDRRISRALPLSQKPGDVDLMDVIRALSREGRERAIQILGDVLNDEIQGLRTRAPIVSLSDHKPRKSGSKSGRRTKTTETKERGDADA